MTLAATVDRYVEHRRASGVKFESGEAVLRGFCRFIGGRTPCDGIPDEAVRAFLDGRGPATRYWLRKRSVLAGFYRYATTRGHASRIPLPSEAPRLAPPLVPYIYTCEEIQRLLQAAAGRRPHPAATVGNSALRALVLLLYGAGLRVGEALGLRLCHVDLEGALLTVRRAKFYKERLVPVGADLRRALERYARERRAEHPPPDDEAPFLADRRGRPLRYSNVQRAFAQTREAAGVRRDDGARYQPRLHDLRHSFATARLTAWYRQGADVQRLLPLLSTDLGHASIEGTRHYLAMTPALPGEAGRRFERHACGAEGGGDD